MNINLIKFFIHSNLSLYEDGLADVGGWLDGSLACCFAASSLTVCVDVEEEQ